MPRSNLTNCDITTLNGAIASANQPGVSGGPTTFTITDSGAGWPVVSAIPTALAPASLPFEPSYFTVTIDTEVLLCSQRSGSTFTIARRGWDGTIAATHANGATVVLGGVRRDFDHIWAALRDGYNPDVPSYQRGGYDGTSTYWDYQSQGVAPTFIDENQFSAPWQGQGAPWTVNAWPATLLDPSSTGGSDHSGNTIDFGVTRKNCLTFRRTSAGNTLYMVTRDFNPPGDWMVTAKMHHSAMQNSTPVALEASLVVSSATSFTTGNEGNQLRIDHTMNGNRATLTYGPKGSVSCGVGILQSSLCITGALQTASQTYTLANGIQYYRLSYNATSHHYRLLVGDGHTWQSLFAGGPFTFTAAVVGFRFWANNVTGNPIEEAVVEWLRYEVPTGFDLP